MMQPYPAQPHTYPRRILLAVAANSPQIVTETVYALTQQVEPVCMPTEVHIITTGLGEPYVRQLLDSDQPGWLARLCADYQLAIPQCGDAFIHQICDDQQRILADVRTRADNTHAANFISQVVRDLTRDPNSSLVVSLSGGRRTMTFYAGHALSLFGRMQDRLTHVLVEEEYFFNAEFFYPPPLPVWVMREDNSGFDASRVEVTLADIPFVRLRDTLPTHLLSGQLSFSEAVARAQSELDPPRIEFFTALPALRCGGVSVAMQPIELAFYSWFLSRQVAGKPPIRWSDDGLAPEFIAEYAGLFGAHSGEYERVVSALSAGMTKEYFESRKSKTNTALRKSLGKKGMLPYQIEAFGKRPETRFGLNLDKSVIHLR